MKTEKVGKIINVAVEILEMKPAALSITVTAQNANSNYSNVRLVPRVYVIAPVNGIYEFDMLGDVPPTVDGVIAKFTALYEWEKFPESVKGIKVYGIDNSETTMVRHANVIKSPAQKNLEIIKAEAWVNTQPIQPTPGGTLIVNVDYNSNQHGFHNLQPTIPQGVNGKILMLELTDSNELIFIFNPRHNSYSQGLQTVDQYSSIELIYKGKQVGVISQIPVIN